jgi:hypothetical protein
MEINKYSKQYEMLSKEAKAVLTKEEIEMILEILEQEIERNEY